MSENRFSFSKAEANEANGRTEAGITPELPAWRRYLAALLCIAVAFAVRYWLTPLLGEELPFMLFIAAALVTAWYGGAAAGTVALLLGLFLADYFFMRRPGAGQLHSKEMVLYFVRYVFTASLGIALIETLHRNRRKLQREIARRQRSEAALLQAQEKLQHHAEELEHCVTNRTAELATTVKYLESLLYHIGHNLRAPLRAMEGYATVFIDEYGSRLDATARDYSAHISDAAKRMDQLIHDLLEYGRLGYANLPLGEVPLDRVLDQVLFRLGFEIRTRNAQVKIAGHLPQVHANAETLEQVLTNLLENAIKFVPAQVQPLITVYAERLGAKVRLSIEDNGPGIPVAYRERIFGVFETLHPSAGQSSTGIGLAIVQQGVERMGGHVGVETAPGGGSVFWIELGAATRASSSENETAMRRREDKLGAPLDSAPAMA